MATEHLSSSVIMRTSGAATWELRECYVQYISTLAQRLEGLATLHLLTDLSMSLPDRLSARELRTLADTHERKLNGKWKGVKPFAYTVADVERFFPRVLWPIPGLMHPITSYHNDTQQWYRSIERSLRAQGRNTSRTLPDGRRLSNLLSYFIHEPSLCLWMRERCSARCRSGHVWVIEEDAAFVGDIKAPLIHYRNHSADLVAVFAAHQYIDDEWWLYLNPGFRSSFPSQPIHKWEHVERYSFALLHQLEQLLHRGLAAYGEVFSSTVCARASWCTSEDLREARVVPSNAQWYADSASISRKELASLLRRELKKPTIGRWVHAVKHDCHLLAVAECFVKSSKGWQQHFPCTLPHVRPSSKYHLPQ